MSTAQVTPKEQPSAFAAALTRLSDPDKAATTPRQFLELSNKISATITRLFRHPENGGNPFLFALAGPKPHQLARELPGGKECNTAATDGKKFYWNPEFLEKLEPDQVATVMMHESYHVLFYHCTPERAGGMKPEVWNIAVDYIVNGVIETEHEKSGRGKKAKTGLWVAPVGPACTLAHYMEWVDGKREFKDDEKMIFADITTYGRSPESIYDQIQQGFMKSPRRCKENAGGCGALSMDPKTGVSKIPAPWGADACQKCGAKPQQGFGPGSMDDHMPPSSTKDEVMSDMMRAAETTRAMGRGSVPNDVEAALGRLDKPDLSPHDIIRATIGQQKKENGNKNDWKRFNRRPQYIYELNEQTGQYDPKHRLYTPKKIDFIPKWVAMVDTSGSMGDDDICNGVKELQLVADVAEGYIVPCDAVPYWDSVTRVTNKSAVARTKIVGRGGTVFNQFFEELPQQKWSKGISLVVIITDGDCGTIPVELCPPGADVLWIVTNKREFKPNFGRVVQLRPAHA